MENNIQFENIQLWKNFQGVYQLDDHLATCNLLPGMRVYGEKLVEKQGKEFRLWDPRRSKLATAILNGLKSFPIQKDSNILYLGASAGTTPSHISDMAPQGLIYCVEFSPRMMRHLIGLCQQRVNLVPILDDATRPQNYLHLAEKVDLLYSDVAQPRQTKLFMDNMRLFLKNDGIGIIMVKSRSIDVTKSPKKVFKEEESKLKTAGFKVLQKVKLEPYEKDHLALVCKFGF
jgi:fibrillarin-like pre-rRNA processing protein